MAKRMNKRMIGMTYEMGSLPIILASNTGNTRTFIPFIQEYAKRDLRVIEDFNNPFPSCNSLAIGAYTWGNGKIPKRLKEYLIENHLQLHGREIFIFGSGNSVYPKFCGAVEGIKKICLDCGADVIAAFKFEQRFNPEKLTKLELNKLIGSIKYWSR
ncbi:flavodoxin domain-containing protein [Bacillus sp. DM2]|uniref:flavodoxin domain-containing protein n=1 Tax=Bacillus sp. DM2 TaxID=2267265 RepID=UPI001F081002|nr:flavodoxin domain-containing protein [Bacillus sp. DM2]